MGVKTNKVLIYVIVMSASAFLEDSKMRGQNKEEGNGREGGRGGQGKR